MRDSGVFVGIDVSKAHLDVGVSGAHEQARFSNSELGIAKLGAWLGRTSPPAAAGMAVVIANPRQVRDFAKATGQLAKTDVIDANPST